MSNDIRPNILQTSSSDLRRWLENARAKAQRRIRAQGAIVWAFGSRTRGDNREASGLDLAVDLGRALTLGEIAALCSAFEESNLPYKVDLVDMRQISAAFRGVVVVSREEIV